MKIIDIGICVDNKDPKGLGRIRCVRFSDYVSEKEKAAEYEPFSDNDLFVASPFLPTNINFIPEIDQAVKIINYDTKKENTNQEYIAGPFTTVHNFTDQSFSSQLIETTYGNSIKRRPDIFDEKENYKRKRSVGSMAQKSDYGVYGKYGSDVIFTENGLQLRGGKLLSKEAATPTDRDNLYSFPIMAQKSSVLTLKKFPHKMEMKTVTDIVDVTEVKDLNFIVEYDIVDINGNSTISSPHSVTFFVYKVLRAYGDITKTNNFNENSILPPSFLKLINLENDNISPTHTIPLLLTSFSDVSSEIRDFFYTIHEDNLKKINSLYNKEDLHPFFFKPKEDFVLLTGSTAAEDFKRNILSSIIIHTVGPKSGLIFSNDFVFPPINQNEVTKEEIILDTNSSEQSFSSLRSDKIFLLSTDTNNVGKIVPFEKLDKYELTQNDYIENIEPNTYATVRGETLLEFLKVTYDVLTKHVHNINEPYARETMEDHHRMVELFNKLEQEMLNKSIRIN